MHYNPERVLYSLEESLLRISLVHSSVSYKFVDIESEDDLLCTRASPSPLLPLSSGFWSDLSTLNKLNASDGSFELSRYISEFAPIKNSKYLIFLDKMEEPLSRDYNAERYWN